MERHWQIWLLSIAILSLSLNLWGADFGLPELWHPDEITGRAVEMARQGSLNPHEFRYGSWHFYQILVVIVPTYLVSSFLVLDYKTQAFVVLLAARALSALLGAGCVALTFLLARRLFDTTTAILAASFLALTMGVVANAHFATVDVPMTFWMTASFLMSAEVLLAGRRRAYLLAAVFAGLAASTKYPGTMALLCLPVAHLLAPRPLDSRALLLALAAFAVTLVAANPPLILDSCEFLEGFIRDNAYSSMQGERQTIPLVIVDNIARGLGPLLSILVGLALVYAVPLLRRQQTRPRILLIAAMIAPTLLLLVSLNANYLRFVIPLFPPLTILAGKAAADLIGARAAYLRFAGAAVVTVVIITSALRSIAADLQMVHDSRELAVEWIERNLPEGARIEVTAYIPRLSDKGFQVIQRPFIHSLELDDWITELPQSPIYRTLQPLYLIYQSFAEAVGICVREPYHYRGWYDRKQATQTNALEAFDQSLAGLRSRAPDALIVSEGYYGRFREDHSSAEGRFFADLFAGKSNYRQVAEIKYQALPWLDPAVDFINPTIRIFQRVDQDGPLSLPLPIPTPPLALDVPERSARDDLEQGAVVRAPVILAPCHLAHVGVQVGADPVMLADLGAAQAREIRLGEVGAGVLIAEGDAVVDPLGIIEGVQLIP